MESRIWLSLDRGRLALLSSKLDGIFPHHLDTVVEDVFAIIILTRVIGVVVSKQLGWMAASSESART